MPRPTRRQASPPVALDALDGVDRRARSIRSTECFDAIDAIDALDRVVDAPIALDGRATRPAASSAAPTVRDAKVEKVDMGRFRAQTGVD